MSELGNKVGPDLLGCEEGERLGRSVREKVSAEGLVDPMDLDLLVKAMDALAHSFARDGQLSAPRQEMGSVYRAGMAAVALMADYLEDTGQQPQRVPGLGLVTLMSDALGAARMARSRSAVKVLAGHTAAVEKLENWLRPVAQQAIETLRSKDMAQPARNESVDDVALSVVRIADLVIEKRAFGSVGGFRGASVLDYAPGFEFSADPGQFLVEDMYGVFAGDRPDYVVYAMGKYPVMWATDRMPGGWRVLPEPVLDEKAEVYRLMALALLGVIRGRQSRMI